MDEFDVVVIGAGPAGRSRLAAAPTADFRGAGRTGAGRRRVLVLGLHPEQDADPPR